MASKGKSWIPFFLTVGFLSLLPTEIILAQNPELVGAAIATACQGVPDPSSHAVLAGTVTDSTSGLGLPGALVSVAWEDGSVPRRVESRTDPSGFFLFCDLPGSTEVEVSVTLHSTGDPVLVRTESGMLHIVPISLAFSDPTSDGILMGRVIDADTRKPVEGASVFLWDDEMRASTITNGRGYFSLGSHPWGIYTVRITHLSYGSTDSPIRIAGDMTQNVEIALAKEPIELEGIVVEAQSRLRAWDMDGLVRRMNAGWGWFITRDRMERMPAGRLGDFVRDVPGVRLVRNRLTTSIVVRGKSCSPEIFVDGMPWIFELDFALDHFLADQLEAVEVFRGHLEIPGEFQTRSDPCAVIAIWTRR
jgi:hypothetical protein